MATPKLESLDIYDMLRELFARMQTLTSPDQHFIFEIYLQLIAL